MIKFFLLGARLFMSPDTDITGGGGTDSVNIGDTSGDSVGWDGGVKNDEMPDYMREFMSGIDIRFKKLADDVAEIQRGMIKPDARNSTLYKDIMDVVNFGMRAGEADNNDKQ